MRAFLALAALALVLSQPVEAQGWKEYRYRDQGFAAQFPAEPRIAEQPYQSLYGNGIVERVYSANSGGVIYSVGIADFRAARPDEKAVIDEAANKLISKGRLTDDVGARLDWNFGREIRVVDADGTSHTNAIFLINGKLFQLKVSYPAVNSDPNGSSGIHFFQQAFWLLF